MLGRKRKSRSKKLAERLTDEADGASKRVMGQLRQQDIDQCVDPFEDEFEQEDIVRRDGNGHLLEDIEDCEEGNELKESDRTRVYFPDDEEDENIELDYDPRAYTTFHKLRVEIPCLSFDILPDDLGNFRTRFPMQMNMVAGGMGRLSVFRVAEIHKTKYDGLDLEDSDVSDDDEDVDYEGAEPIIEEAHVDCNNIGINRVRAMPQMRNVVATWCDDSSIKIWDIECMIQRAIGRVNNSPKFSLTGHRQEGFALDWSPVEQGYLASGDCAGDIMIWAPAEGGWAPGTRFSGHCGSVEDLQWSPTEARVFASCSCDQSIQFWDERSSSRNSVIGLQKCHDSDVNVLSWNKAAAHLIVSGGDDGAIKVWDLRMLKSNPNPTESGDAAACEYRWHRKPITSVQWHPFQESVFAASSEDDSISVWDLGLEDDPDETWQGADLGNVRVPPQLIFIHRGQNFIKEIQFHHQIPSLITSTSMDGFDFFKPDNL